METTFGRYTIIRKLAKGGMAEVFLARATGPMGFEKTVVLKRMLPELASDEAFVQMFLAEARLAAGFSHPHVAQVFDFGQHDNTLFIAMEYVDGPTLRALVRRSRALGFDLPCDVVARILADACAGLHYVHELKDQVSGRPLQLVHRDISPENIIVSQAGVVKVLDFGIVKSGNSDRAYTKSGTVRGKLGYMSPEQISEEPIDRRTDVWALGMVLFEVLTGRPPYRATQDAAVMKAILMEPFIKLSELRPDAPLKLGAIVERCFAKDKRMRFQSARELQVDLDALISSMGPTIGEHEVEEMIRALDEGRKPKEGSATLPGGAAALKVLDDPDRRTRGVDEVTTRKQPLAAPGPFPPLATSEKRERKLLGALIGFVVMLIASVAWLQRPRVGEVVAPREPQVTVVDAGAVAGSPEPGPDAGPSTLVVTPPVLTDAGSVRTSAGAGADAGAVDAPATPDAGRTTATDPRPAADAGAAAVRRRPDAGVRQSPTPAPRNLVRVDFRILPEGTALLDGAPVTSVNVKSGPLEILFVNKRFGEHKVRLQVPDDCEGVFRVGYSFASDLLTSRCTP